MRKIDHSLAVMTITNNSGGNCWILGNITPGDMAEADEGELSSRWNWRLGLLHLLMEFAFSKMEIQDDGAGLFLSNQAYSIFPECRFYFRREIKTR